jgi:hypothetical protein
MELKNLRNKDVAYLVGSFQSDGYFYKFIDKKRNKTENRFGICGGKKSLKMLKRFNYILAKFFLKNIQIQKVKGKNYFYVRTSINRIINYFYKLEILPKKFESPSWIFNNDELFGSYLAGIIDGDGSVCIKRKKYPQCRIRICDGKPPEKLKRQIISKLKCTARIYFVRNISFMNGREIYGKGYYLEFYVSSKNLEFIKKYVYPEIQIEYKKEKLKRIINIKSSN